MADVITRFKLETSQYDSKLRDASKSLRSIADEAAKAGKAFEGFSKEQVDAARSFGKVESGANSVKGKLKDLVGAYNDAAKAYNNLSEEQKKSDFGKAMSESLQTLQTRITQTKTELYGLGSETKNTGGVLGQFADKLTVNIDAVKLLNGALSAAKGALSVAKDAFFASEQNIDEWGRIVSSAKSLYNGFLNALNTGDISGYLSRIDDIVIAARKAYDELDRLGTMRTIQAPQMSAQQAENDRIRMMLQTGRGIESANGSFPDRLLGIKNGELLSPQTMRVLEKILQNGVNNTIKLVKNEVEQSTKSIDAIYGSLAITNGMSLAEFRSGTSSMAELDKRIAGARAYRQWADEHSYVDQATGAYRTLRGNPYANYRGWETFLDDSKEFKDLVALIVQRDQQMSQMYNMQGQAYRTINRVNGITVRGIMGGSGGRVGGTAASALSTGSSWSGSIADYALQIRSLQAQQQQVTSHAQYAALQQQIDYIQQQIDFISGKSGSSIGTSIMGMGSSSVKAAQEAFNSQQLNVSMVDGPVKQLENGANTVKMSWQDAASAIQSVGSAFSMIEDPAAKVIGIIGQAVATIALGFAQATAQAAAGGPLAWIAAVAGGMGTMISTIAAIKQATAGSYAEGGIVPGNNYNDGLVANVSSGELILNAAQQRNVANNLIGQRANTRPYVDAETIVLGVNNYLRRSGRGELVTTR